MQEHHLQAVLSAASQRNQALGARAARGAPEKNEANAKEAYIPVPDSTGVTQDYEEFYPPFRWTDPSSYVRTSETVEEGIESALVDDFTYIMDERDKEWLDKNNEEARGEGTSAQGALASGATTRSGVSQRSAKAKGKEADVPQPIPLSEDEFELVMGIFEKVTHEKTEFLHHVRILLLPLLFRLIIWAEPGDRNGIPCIHRISRCIQCSHPACDVRVFYCAYMASSTTSTGEDGHRCIPLLA
jgi:enhancer of polycomb-like protein